MREHAAEYLERATALRRRLHEWPEIGNYLPRTRDQVLADIEDLSLRRKPALRCGGERFGGAHRRPARGGGHQQRYPGDGADRRHDSSGE